MPIRIIAVGKKHEPWIESGIERFEKRLKRPYMVEWILLPHSAYDGLKVRQEESERIRNRIQPDDFVVLLDEHGQMDDSPTFAGWLVGLLGQSKKVVFVIGGAYGVDETIQGRADKVWSLSLLVFPHQLVRLLLIEQLYRAQEIAAGKAYHHE